MVYKRPGASTESSGESAWRQRLGLHGSDHGTSLCWLRALMLDGGTSPKHTPSLTASAMGSAKGHYMTTAFINRDFWEEGTNAFVRLIFPARDAFHFGELRCI